MHPLPILLFVCTFHFTKSLFYANYFNCATTNGYNHWAELFMQLDCGRKMSMVSQCCSQHFKCYQNRDGKRRCDQKMCDCMQKAVQGNDRCRAHSNTYCEWIKADRHTYGEMKKISGM